MDDQPRPFDRYVCRPCEVLVTERFAPICWVCAKPMTSAKGYVEPQSIAYRNPMLAHLEETT
jgi:ribosomal protein L37AE/L43A